MTSDSPQWHNSSYFLQSDLGPLTSLLQRKNWSVAGSPTHIFSQDQVWNKEFLYIFRYGLITCHMLLTLNIPTNSLPGFLLLMCSKYYFAVTLSMLCEVSGLTFLVYISKFDLSLLSESFFFLLEQAFHLLEVKLLDQQSH